MKRRIYRIKRESSKEPGPSLGEKLARIFEIPEDVVGSHPRVTAIGRGEVLVENFKGIVSRMEYQDKYK